MAQAKPHRTRPQPALVVVGGRRAGIEAAAACGLPVIAVCQPSRRPCRDTVYVQPPADESEAAWHALGADLAAHAPAAVVALTEAAVTPAAWLARGAGLEDRVASAQRTTDKASMKAAILEAGLACARFVTAEEGLDAAGLHARLGLPMVIKKRVGSGGRGTAIVRRRRDIPPQLAAGWMAEGFVDGVEMSVEALLAGGEIRFVNHTEYLRPRWANVVPARLGDAERQAIDGLLGAAVSALGVRCGIVHLEIFRTQGGPVFGELAARPPGGHIMRLIERAYGFDPWRADFDLHLGRRVALPQRAVRAAGVWILHPGAGALTRIDGERIVAGIDGVEIRVHTRPGDRIPPRDGVGQESGHILAVAADREAVIARLVRARRALRFHLQRDEAGGPAAQSRRCRRSR